ncbi:MAG: ATP-dependent RecD-like DNA helicase [Candidatus Hydrogenedens sp.]|nr:ATP-dependent RecD-like DNA helicase [Candidatus Hydrogenedens sp.]
MTEARAEAAAQTEIAPPVTLEGVVERIVFESPESGFLVARLKRGGQPELDTFVGNMLAVSAGETVRLRGQWIEDKKFGRQLKVETCEVLVPNTLEGIEKYLGSGLIEGIGPTYAKRLVAAFGENTLRVIDEAPAKLRQVPGIGRKRAEQIRASWESHKEVQAIMVFLQGHGIRPAQAARIYQVYGDKAITVLRQNPFRLAEDISGIGFQGADAMARSMGIEQDAPARLQAGLKHVLNQALTRGHVFLPRGELLDEATELLGVPRNRVEPQLAEALAMKGLASDGEAIYLPQFREAESECARLLKQLLSAPHDAPDIKMDNALKWVERENNIALSDEQRDAIRRGCEEKVLVITGGPGTGKTTVINSLLAILEKKGVSFLLAAPTGRAAKRMEEATGREAQTLHRLLEFSPKSGGFVRNESDPLVTDLLVVDETSMVDELLMHAVLRALPFFARLVLVGDVDQLPSVGAGNVLFDIIASGTLPVVRLQKIFRQAEESAIVRNAHRINQGDLPEFNTEDFLFIERPEPAQALDTVVELLSRRIPQGLGLDPLRDVQVLSPMRRGEAGTVRLNEALQEALNPHGAPVAGRTLRHGDKVIQLKNNYDLEVYNGDVGIIRLDAPGAEEIEVEFEDGRRVLYPYAALDQLGLAYAMTIHKSQGSEYHTVVIPLLGQHYMMLQRNVLYTAVTRGKQRVILVGEKKAIAMAVKNNRQARRNTLLSERLRNVV